MVNPGEKSSEIVVPDGERWLELLGYGELKGHQTGYYLGTDGKPYTAQGLLENGLEGEPVPAEEFDKLCGEWARPMLIGLESMGPDNPDFEVSRNLLRKKFKTYFKSVEES